MRTNGRISKLPAPDEVVERAKTGNVDDSMNSVSLLDLEDWELEPRPHEQSASQPAAKKAKARGDSPELARHGERH